ncbi:hypothetical protein BDQ12DRAFT_672021 [Crucibulum laeve]|uniref:Uncharacterized protein n=1 Tax=Crucibulum laeve TaxID=68775 RepID=A0A5C3LDS5_9AGAR|nr:hypothetical protein BDQ12DRAFT_672021 [Crucibulum laeve]
MDAWNILQEFATADEMSLPQAEACLMDCLGTAYEDADWRPSLNAVMEAENDTAKALEAIEELALVVNSTPSQEKLTIRIPARPQAPVPQVTTLEGKLMACVSELRSWNQLHGEALSVNQLLDPEGEKEIGDSPYRFEGGDDKILAEAMHQLAVERGEFIEIDSDSEDEEGSNVLSAELRSLCQQLKGMCIRYSDGDPQAAMDLCKELCQFRGRLQASEFQKAKQVTLDSYMQTA